MTSKKLENFLPEGIKPPPESDPSQNVAPCEYEGLCLRSGCALLIAAKSAANPNSYPGDKEWIALIERTTKLAKEKRCPLSPFMAEFLRQLRTNNFLSD